MACLCRGVPAANLTSHSCQQPRWGGAIEDWTHGTPPGYLAELVDHWRTKFDWRKAETGLNALPQFLAEVDGRTVHFLHAQGVGPAPLPLLFFHGWSGSFWEVHKIEHGGHFAALERPRDLVHEIREFFRSLR